LGRGNQGEEKTKEKPSTEASASGPTQTVRGGTLLPIREGQKKERCKNGAEKGLKKPHKGGQDSPFRKTINYRKKPNQYKSRLIA